MSSSSNNNLSKVRKSIENAIEVAEEDRRRKLLNLRLELARSGIIAFQNKQITQAVRAFHSYIKILEDAKNVGEGGLQPTNFDLRRDVPELLMISGVYWDLAKLYDRTQTSEKQREFRHYLEKYIIFSKGMPFQALCAETLRKYISNEKPYHIEEFKSAYRILGDSRCFVATSLIDVTSSKTIPSLRNFRDLVLERSTAGRRFILWYYQVGPKIAQVTDRLPAFLRRLLGGLLDFAAHLVSLFTQRAPKG